MAFKTEILSTKADLGPLKPLKNNKASFCSTNFAVQKNTCKRSRSASLTSSLKKKRFQSKGIGKKLKLKLRLNWERKEK